MGTADPHSRALRSAGQTATLPQLSASEISGDQIVRTSASAYVDLGSGGAYPITVEIECIQKARLIRTGIWLKALQRAFVYEKRCLYRAIVAPKSYRMPRSIIGTAVIWKFNHVL